MLSTLLNLYKLQFKYNTTIIPDAPFIDLRVESYFGESLPEKGKIDTGADKTGIPKYLVGRLNLQKHDERTIQWGNGTQTREDMYFVYIGIGETKFELMEVVALDKNYVLVGRDLINLWTLILDGKNKVGDISVWSTKPNDVYT